MRTGLTAVIRTQLTTGIRTRLTTGVVVTALALAGCAAESPVSPLPIEAAATSTVPSPPATRPASVSPTTSLPTTLSPSPRPAAPPRTTETATSSPKPSRTTTSPSSSCRGAVVYTIDTNDELALARGVCLAVGAVLRIENIGPGEVTNDAPDLVDPHYEAGVYEILLVRPGTVVVTIQKDDHAYDIPVVIR